MVAPGVCSRKAKRTPSFCLGSTTPPFRVMGRKPRGAEKPVKKRLRPLKTVAQLRPTKARAWAHRGGGTAKAWVWGKLAGLAALRLMVRISASRAR